MNDPTDPIEHLMEDTEFLRGVAITHASGIVANARDGSPVERLMVTLTDHLIEGMAVACGMEVEDVSADMFEFASSALGMAIGWEALVERAMEGAPDHLVEMMAENLDGAVILSVALAARAGALRETQEDDR